MNTYIQMTMSREWNNRWDDFVPAVRRDVWTVDPAAWVYDDLIDAGFSDPSALEAHDAFIGSIEAALDSRKVNGEVGSPLGKIYWRLVNFPEEFNRQRLVVVSSTYNVPVMDPLNAFGLSEGGAR